MTTDLLLINAIVGIIIPLIVQLLAHRSSPDWVKTVVNVALSAAVAVLAPLVAAPHVDWKVIALSFVQVFAVAIVSHLGILKPAGITGADGFIATQFPGGVGAATPVATA
jgi:hypothetical protein